MRQLVRKNRVERDGEGGGWFGKREWEGGREGVGWKERGGIERA